MVALPWARCPRCDQVLVDQPDHPIWGFIAEGLWLERQVERSGIVTVAADYAVRGFIGFLGSILRR